jgi:hypothetical protein
VKSFSSPASRLLTVAAAVSMAGALTLVGVTSASAAQDSHQAQATAFHALPAGAHILESGSNRYGSYEFVEQPAGASHAARPDSGGGCSTDAAWLWVCASITGSGLHVNQMISQTTFSWGGDGSTAEVQILSPKKAQLASWWGSVPESGEVTAYWTPNSNEPTGWYCGQSSWYGETVGTQTASYCVQVYN